MIDGDPNQRTQSIAKINITMKRNPGVKELLEKIQKENEAESVSTMLFLICWIIRLQHFWFFYLHSTLFWSRNEIFPK